jgi:hypothetical protein
VTTAKKDMLVRYMVYFVSSRGGGALISSVQDLDVEHRSRPMGLGQGREQTDDLP